MPPLGRPRLRQNVKEGKALLEKSCEMYASSI